MNSPIAGLFSQTNRPTTTTAPQAPVGVPMAKPAAPAPAPQPQSQGARSAMPAQYAWDNADGTGAGRYPFIQPGLHRLKLVDSRIQTSRKGKTLTFVDYEVVCSNNKDFPPGSFMTWCIDMNNVDMAPINLMKLVSAQTGLPASVFKADPTQTQALIESLINDPSCPMRGTVVDATCYDKETKRGSNFTVCDPRPVSGYSLKDFDELRKAGKDPLVELASVPVIPGMAPF